MFQPESLTDEIAKARLSARAHTICKVMPELLALFRDLAARRIALGDLEECLLEQVEFWCLRFLNLEEED